MYEKIEEYLCGEKKLKHVCVANFEEGIVANRNQGIDKLKLLERVK